MSSCLGRFAANKLVRLAACAIDTRRQADGRTLAIQNQNLFDSQDEQQLRLQSIEA